MLSVSCITPHSAEFVQFYGSLKTNEFGPDKLVIDITSNDKPYLFIPLHRLPSDPWHDNAFLRVRILVLPDNVSRLMSTIPK